MNKSRKGDALIIALVVVLVGGIIIALSFDIVFRYAWFSLTERAGYVDHTTMLDVVQTAKANICQSNLDDGKAVHAAALKYDQGYDYGDSRLNDSLNLSDLVI